MYQHSHYNGPRRRRENGPEKIFEEIIAENFSNMGKEINHQLSLGSTKSPKKDKPKEEHTETHGNQTDKNLKR